MDAYLFPVLAIIASLLSAGGLISQVIAWRREREKALVKGREAEVELAKVSADDAKDERGHVERFQAQLMERLAKLEELHDENVGRIALLEAANIACTAQYSDLRTQYANLQRDHQRLKEDHERLKEHVVHVDEENRGLRIRLAQLDAVGLQ